MHPPAGYGALVRAGVGADGPVAIWSRPGEHALPPTAEQSGSATFPKSGPWETRSVALTEYGDRSTTPTAVTFVSALDVAYPMLQRLPNGNFLVVGTRCQWSPDGPELNGLVVAPDGSIVRRGCLGDGIEHVQVAENGTIWVGYFDEGVFGNFGWGYGGPEPLGAPGVVAWSLELEKVWELDASQGLVADCEALNVAGDDVWVCPYTDFPVVRISDGGARVFSPPNQLLGVDGIIVDGERFGLIGSYEEPSLFITGGLAGDRWIIETRGELTLPDGSPLPKVDVHCRGAVAHLFHGSTWYTFALNAE